MTTVLNRFELAEQVSDLCCNAGKIIVEVYNDRSSIELEYKADNSPVTRADKLSHNFIVSGLQRLTPDIPVLSEEQILPDFSLRRQWERYWLVDPLDGTREFIDRTGEFTINIALIERGKPVLGVIGVPLESIVYMGVPANSSEAALALKITAGERRPITTSDVSSASTINVLTSSRDQGIQLKACIERLQKGCTNVNWIKLGSALKFCHLAEGAGHLYPRYSPCYEWDVAAGHALLLAAGGCLVNTDFDPVVYNRQSSLLVPWFYALGERGDNGHHGFIVECLTQ